MKDWMNQYKTTRKYQAGGAMPPPQGAPAGPGGGGAPDLEAMLAEYAQTRDPQLAVAICDMLVEMAMQSQGGGGGGAPAGPPMARQGAKLTRGPIFRV